MIIYFNQPPNKSMKILKAIITIGIGLLPALTHGAILTGPVTNSADAWARSPVLVAVERRP